MDNPVKVIHFYKPLCFVESAGKLSNQLKGFFKRIHLVQQLVDKFYNIDATYQNFHQGLYPKFRKPIFNADLT